MKVNSCVLYDTCFQSIRIFLLGNAHTFDCFGRSGSNTFRHSIQGLPKQLLVTPLPIFGAKRKRKPFKRDKSTSRDFVARSAASGSNKLILNFMRSTCGKSRSIRFEITMGNNRILVIWFTAQSQSASISCYGACLKWLLPELSFSDRWSRGTKLWDCDWLRSTFYCYCCASAVVTKIGWFGKITVFD